MIHYRTEWDARERPLVLLTRRQRGAAMLLALILALAFAGIATMSVQMSLTYVQTRRTQEAVVVARQIAESGAAHALTAYKEGGVATPMSGGGGSGVWVTFSDGDYFYETTVDPVSETAVVQSWGRIAVTPNPSSCSLAPTDPSWDGTGWLLKGIEITLQNSRYLPEAPMYMGNGGVEEPMGGFDPAAAGADPNDPSTWVAVTSPDSYQDPSVPLEISALDHPADFLYGGSGPIPASTNPHPRSIWASQTIVGQFNSEAWFQNSAGVGSDPTINVTPPPTASYYDVSDPTSPDYPYPIDPNVPDVQDFSWELWRLYKNDAGAPKLGSGSHSGVYGDLATPLVTFVTGALNVDAGQTFSGAGILVVRDDYDPNTQTNNVPSTRAMVNVSGTFEWTGLVIVAGWAPAVAVQSGANATVVGSLFGEDSVMSGSELSLDSATIIMTVDGSFRLLYSAEVFQPGGLVHSRMPFVKKRIVGMRDISGP